MLAHLKWRGWSNDGPSIFGPLLITWRRRPTALMAAKEEGRGGRRRISRTAEVLFSILGSLLPPLDGGDLRAPAARDFYCVMNHIRASLLGRRTLPSPPQAGLLGSNSKAPESDQMQKFKTKCALNVYVGLYHLPFPVSRKSLVRKGGIGNRSLSAEKGASMARGAVLSSSSSSSSSFFPLPFVGLGQHRANPSTRNGHSLIGRKPFLPCEQDFPCLPSQYFL